MQITVCLGLGDAQMANLRRRAGDWPLIFAGGDDPCDSPIVFGNPEPQVVATNPNLRWLQLESVGFGEYAALDWARYGGTTQVTNLAGFFADPVAETALAGILALRRGIDRLAVLRTRGEWVGDPIRANLNLLTGARVVLFGRGSINSRLAELLAPFRCSIESFGSDWTPDALDAALAEADVVVATVPDAPGTREVFGAARFGQMKSGAVFCNFGRGSLLHDAALAKELTTGRLGGAVIDVTLDEPLAVGHPYWTTPNTILTQHSAGGTSDEIDRKIDHFLTNLVRFRAGEPLFGQVDFSRGY